MEVESTMERPMVHVRSHLLNMFVSSRLMSPKPSVFLSGKESPHQWAVVY